LLERHA